MQQSRFAGRQRRLTVSALVGLIAAMGTAAGSTAAPSAGVTTAAPAPPPKINPLFTYNKRDRTDRLYTCARREGKVVFYTSSSATNPTFKPAFEKRFPGVQMETYIATAELPAKLRQEEDAGRHNFDVYGDTLGNLGRDAKYFQPIFTPRAKLLRAHLSKPYYVAYAGFLEGLAYNPNVISPTDVPKTWRELLQPKWAGKVYMGVDTATASFIGLLNRKLGPAFIDQLARQIRVQQTSGRAIADQVIAGTIPIGINISSSYHKTNYVDRGAPIRWVPLDPVPGFFQAASISKRAPHPCAAALLIDWLMGEAGAQPLWRGLGNANPFKSLPLLPYDLKATSPPFTIPSKWNVYMTTNPDYYKPYKNYQAALTAWNEIVQTKFLNK
jgi:iron(III) transport system substrate-binding protein